MIPQRNLSLLANRLYKEHGGRRIPEAVLERDYCLAWFLVGLSQSKLRDLLIFKGGTALKRCHFGDYRFSEDLDFTLVRRVKFAEIREGLEEVYELVAQASGIRFSFEAEDRQTHVNSYTFYLRYQGPLPTSNTVKVDITVAEILLFPVERLPVLRTYPEFEDVPEDRPISVYSLNEIATEKIVALQDRARNEPRDLYDLWFLTSHEGVDIGHLIGAGCNVMPPPCKVMQPPGGDSKGCPGHPFHSNPATCFRRFLPVGLELIPQFLKTPIHGSYQPKAFGQIALQV